MNLFPESLAGRKLIFELYPLDFEEFLRLKPPSELFGIPFRARRFLSKGFNFFDVKVCVKTEQSLLCAPQRPEFNIKWPDPQNTQSFMRGLVLW